MACRFWQAWVLACSSACPLASANAQQTPIADTIEQRMKACVVCHGERGADARISSWQAD